MWSAKLRVHVSEDVIQVRSEGIDRDDDRDRNASGDETILNSRSSRLVSHKTRK